MEYKGVFTALVTPFNKDDSIDEKALQDLVDFQIREGVDGVLPMMYHKYYNENVEWIKKVTKEGKKELPASIPLYSGLHISMLEPEELPLAVKNALDGGADGIVLFTAWSMTDKHWEKFKEISNYSGVP